ncbi:hypothetical protein COLO4_01962 [Corchorus olitorius]|uniref:Uncharacterized protein n=1 Tax=Corchorus olitorius TaxID=93759 RepID=A0A1R3L1Q3_9ROSI|nr:hypothetical protein COLO4_01962 [Corchorus olitorius]
MQGSSSNRVEKFGNSKKAAREQLNGKRDNKKLNKTVRGRVKVKNSKRCKK